MDPYTVHPRLNPVLYNIFTIENTQTRWRESTEQERKKEPLHKYNDNTQNNREKKRKSPTPPMLTCVVLKVKVNHHKRSCHLTSHTSKYGPEMPRNGVGGGEGALTSCIWALKSAHEDNWKDCIITWATACGGEHTTHSPWSGTDST